MKEQNIKLKEYGDLSGRNYTDICGYIGLRFNPLFDFVLIKEQARKDLLTVIANYNADETNEKGKKNKHNVKNELDTIIVFITELTKNKVNISELEVLDKKLSALNGNEYHLYGCITLNKNLQEIMKRYDDLTKHTRYTKDELAIYKQKIEDAYKDNSAIKKDDMSLYKYFQDYDNAPDAKKEKYKKKTTTKNKKPRQRYKNTDSQLSMLRE